MLDARNHAPAVLHVRVTQVDTPEFSAFGEAIDISKSDVSAYLPLAFTPGTAVRVHVKKSVLNGVIVYSYPERSFFRTGIEVVEVSIGKSALEEASGTSPEYSGTT